MSFTLHSALVNVLSDISYAYFVAELLGRQVEPQLTEVSHGKNV